MAGLADENVVDLVGTDADGHTLVIMVETRPWGSEEGQAKQLMAKFNAYAGFIMDGSLARHFPALAGRPADIQLNCYEPPSGEFAAIIEYTEDQLRQLGIGFRIHLMAKTEG